MPKASAKILVIEDSPTQAAVIADIVRQAGHEPVVYSELTIGISQILAKEVPRIVLLDLKLLDREGNPAADGFQLCGEIKRSTLKPTVIVISAEGDDEACEWAILQGADGYLQKPFVAKDLLAAIASALA